MLRYDDNRGEERERERTIKRYVKRHSDVEENNTEDADKDRSRWLYDIFHEHYVHLG